MDGTKKTWGELPHNSSQHAHNAYKAGAGTERTGLTIDGKAPYCQLFKGDPLPGGGTLGLQTGKSIYMKQSGNPDEREAEDALSKK